MNIWKADGHNFGLVCRACIQSKTYNDFQLSFPLHVWSPLPCVRLGPRLAPKPDKNVPRSGSRVRRGSSALFPHTCTHVTAAWSRVQTVHRPMVRYTNPFGTRTAVFSGPSSRTLGGGFCGLLSSSRLLASGAELLRPHQAPGPALLGVRAWSLLALQGLLSSRAVIPLLINPLCPPQRFMSQVMRRHTWACFIP